MLRSTILAAARNRRIERLVTTAPVSRSVVHRFVGGADTAAAVKTTRKLVRGGYSLRVSSGTGRRAVKTVYRVVLR